MSSAIPRRDMETARILRTSLFVADLSCAIGIAVLLTQLTTMQEGSVVACLISTLSIISIIQLCRRSGSPGDECSSRIFDSNDSDPIMLYERRERKKLRQFIFDGDLPAASPELEQFIRDSSEDDAATRSMPSYSLDCTLTPALRFAVTILVLFHNVWRLKSSVRLAVGRDMSPPLLGPLFRLFLCLVERVACRSSAHGGGESLQLAFDCLSISSSRLTLRKPAAGEGCDAKGHRPRWGLALKDVAFAFTILLRRKGRDSYGRIEQVTSHSTSLRLELKSFEIGLAPRLCDWIKVDGVRVKIHSSSTPANCNPEIDALATSDGGVQLFLMLDRANVYTGKGVSCSELKCRLLDREATVASMLVPPWFLMKSAAKYKQVDQNKTAKETAGSTGRSEKVKVSFGQSGIDSFVLGADFQAMRSILEMMGPFLRELGQRKGAISSQKPKKTSNKTQFKLDEVDARVNLHCYALLRPSLDQHDECLTMTTSLRTYLNEQSNNLAMVNAGNFNVRRHLIEQERGDSCVISLGHVNVYRAKEELESNDISTVKVGPLTARVNDSDIEKVAGLLCQINCIKRIRNELKGKAQSSEISVSDQRRGNLGTKVARNIGRLTLSVDSVDTAFLVSDGESIARIALLIENKLIATLERNIDEDVAHQTTDDLKSFAPRELFDAELSRCEISYFVRAEVKDFKCAMAFTPHSQLPRIGDFCIKPDKTLFIQISELGIRSTLPTNTSTDEISKAIDVSFACLNLYEVDQVVMQHNDSASYFSSLLDHAQVVKVASCDGAFCLLDKISIRSRERHEFISMDLGDISITWSPISQWLMMSCVKRIDGAKNLFRARSSVQHSNAKVRYDHMTSHIRITLEPSASAKVDAYIGVRTVAHAAIDGFIMNVSLEKPTSGQCQTKPNVALRTQRLEICLDDVTSPIFLLDSISLNNVTRTATREEVQHYMSKQGNSCCLATDVAVDSDGNVLKEIFELCLGPVVATLPPELHLGAAIEDLLLTPKALFAGLNSLKTNYVRPKKKYQLMSIKFSAPFLSIIALRDADPSDPVDRSGRQEELGLCIENLEFGVERNCPPSHTQTQIQSFDEDGSDDIVYGSVIQGGLMTIYIENVFFSLRPLNLALPLAMISNLRLSGYLFLCEVDQSCQVVQGRPVIHRLNHHGRSDYCLTTYASGIPVKVYTDSDLTCAEISANWGQVMGTSVPRLMECIARILPPPPEPVAGIPPLAWWDNVRFLVHGSIKLSSAALKFRWLLDAVENADESILLQCSKFCINYSVGRFEVEAVDLTLSVPSIPYDMSIHPSDKALGKPSIILPHQVQRSTGDDMQPLLYVCELSLITDIEWKTKGSCYGHHSAYMKGEQVAPDKFTLFRSDGCSIEYDVVFPSGSECSNWIALRIDLLPWFTHLNTAISYPRPVNDQEHGPLPEFRRVSIDLEINDLKLVTWFGVTRDNRPDSVCFLFPRVQYQSMHTHKEIIIEPSKAALFDLSGMNLDQNSTNNFDSNNEMEEVEMTIDEFASTLNLTTNKPPNPSAQRPRSIIEYFLLLQDKSNQIEELDFVIETNQIDVTNRSLGAILSEIGEDNHERRTTMLDEHTYQGQNRTTWCILVSQLRLLWTLDIRDTILSVSKDLIYAIGYMKAQVRLRQKLETTDAEDGDWQGLGQDGASIEDGYEIALPHEQSNEYQQSRLGYLLDCNESIENSTEVGDKSPHRPAMDTKRNSTLPTLDIQFSNPQVQLHSNSTGGSIVLAAESAHIEGRKFSHFIISNSRSSADTVTTSDLLRKTEQTYSISNMEAYSTSVDVDIVGLPWLQTQDDSADPSVSGLEEHFVIGSCETNTVTDREDHPPSKKIAIFPNHLRHHEPLPFLQSGLLSKILEKFTCQSQQLFHREPVHYSKDDLSRFIKLGLVVEDRGTDIVDGVNLSIDTLSFNLNSYQYRTTLDVIRNVLLVPPQQHVRNQRIELNEEDDEPRTPVFTQHVDMSSSTARDELEDALRDVPTDRGLGKKSRQALRTVASNLLQDLEDKIVLLGGARTNRRISYDLSRLLWRIESEEVLDDVTIDITGFQGEHEYSSNGSVVSSFSLADINVSSSKPGPDSINFVDPTSVFKAELEGEKSGKERLAAVRVETLPRVVKGFTLYNHVEVNLFPGVVHHLVVQISKSIGKLFLSYFGLSKDDLREEHDSASISSGTTITAAALSTDPSASPTQKFHKKSLLIGGKDSPRSSNSAAMNDARNDLKGSASADASSSQEITFVKVLRIGHSDMNISFGGFRRLNQTSLDISVPAYQKVYKIGSFTYLVQKYLKHLTVEIVKSGASSVFLRKKISDLGSDEILPTLPETDGYSDRGSIIARHLRRSMDQNVGAEQILGAPKRSKTTKMKISRGVLS